MEKGKYTITKKEVLRRFNELIAKGEIYRGRDSTGVELSKIMEAYKVEYVDHLEKYGYKCVLCGERVGDADFIIFCRRKGTSYRWKEGHPVHAMCLVRDEDET